MRSEVSAEKLARIAKVKVTTVRRTAKELLEMLDRDREIMVLKGERGQARHLPKMRADVHREGQLPPGPLEGRYEWLCGPCYNIEGMVRTIQWKKTRRSTLGRVVGNHMHHDISHSFAQS